MRPEHPADPAGRVLTLPGGLAPERRAALWARIAAALPGSPLIQTANPDLRQDDEATAVPAG